MTPGEIRVRAISGMPRVRPGDDLGALLADAIGRSGESLRDGDVVVVAQKIVSKAEGRIVRLADVDPSPRAIELGARVDKDPRAVEVILGEAVEVLRAVPGVLIVETRHGIVLANAGADMSNIEHDEEDDHLLLLPEDPDASADRLRASLEAGGGGAKIGVVVGGQRRAGVAGGHGRPRDRGKRHSRPPRPARRARPLRPRPPRHRGRDRGLDRVRRLHRHGRGGGGQARRPRPRALVRGPERGGASRPRARPRPPPRAGPLPVILALAGGVGGAKLAAGLQAALDSPKPSSPSSTPGTTSSTWGSASAPTSTP